MKIKGKLIQKHRIELNQKIDLPEGTEVEVIIKDKEGFSKKDPLFLLKGSGHSGKEDISQNILAQDWHGLKPVLAVASGGLSPLQLPQVMKVMGNDIVMQGGGGVHGHPEGTMKGATAFRQAVDAAMENISLSEYAKTHKELAKAIEKWG